MASSSSSCEIVDLSLAAIRDDASSNPFFNGDGGGDLSWPVAEGLSSTLTNQETLVALCRKYGVPSELEPVCADTLGCKVCQTPPEGSNALCIYSDALEAGLRFPLHEFYLKLLRHYGLAPSQLAPNAWNYMAAFVLRCKEAGVEPMIPAFRHFFAVYAHKDKDIPLGWHHFHVDQRSSPTPAAASSPALAGRRLFTGGALRTKRGWKTRFFFLKSPKGMPWKCPVAWGKPRMEDARTVEVSDAAIIELKKMPCIDFKSYLSLHAPPVGDRTLLQLHSTIVPMVKQESAAASAQALALTLPAHQLHTTLEPSGTDTADDSTRRKRRCPSPGLASVTMTPPMPETFAIGAAPQPQGMGKTPACETSFDGAWGNDALYSMVAIDSEKARLQHKEQAIHAMAAQQIAHLQGQLHQANAANTKSTDDLVVARAENAQLKEKYASEIAKLKKEHATEVAKLQVEHHKVSTHAGKVKSELTDEIVKLQDEHHQASTAHAVKVKSEIAKLQEKHATEVAKINQAHDAAVARLMEKHKVDVARLKHDAEDEKKDIVRFLFPDLDF